MINFSLVTLKELILSKRLYDQFDRIFMGFIWDLSWDSWESSLFSKNIFREKYSLSRKKGTITSESSPLASICASLESCS